MTLLIVIHYAKSNIDNGSSISRGHLLYSDFICLVPIGVTVDRFYCILVMEVVVVKGIVVIIITAVVVVIIAVVVVIKVVVVVINVLIQHFITREYIITLEQIFFLIGI